MINSLHELKICFALNLSDIAIESTNVCPPPSGKIAGIIFLVSEGLYYGES